MSLNLTQEGTLWIVATPLGNPGDLSPRAAKVLEEADFVLAEDTRRSGQLFARCGVEVKKFISFHDHNEAEQIDFVLAELRQGKNVALVSDAGMPLLSDPGFRLVRAARKDIGLLACETGGGPAYKISVVPGPSAILAALAGSGIAPQPFVFLGFLPRRDAEQAKIFSQYIGVAATLIFFERKDRLAQTLQVAHTCLGSREVCIARELTKTHEEFIFGRLGQTECSADERPFPPEDLLGEITVVIGPSEEEMRTDERQILAIAARLSANEPELRPKDCARKVCEFATGWSVKDVYEFLQGEKE